jgi:hypothetical protein
LDVLDSTGADSCFCHKIIYDLFIYHLVI